MSGFSLVSGKARHRLALALTVAGLGLSLPVAHVGLAQTAPKKTKSQAATTTTTPAFTTTPLEARPSTAPSAEDDGDVVARAGDRRLTAEDIRAFVKTLPSADQAALARDPALLGQTLRILLANQLVLKEAEEKSWDQQPNVAAQVQRAGENLIVQTFLQSASAPPEGYPSEAEIQQAYEAAKSQLIVPRQFQVAQIFVASPDGADAGTMAKANTKLADIQAKLKQVGADFAAIAKTDSDERVSGARGGEIGWLAEAQMLPEIKAAVVGLVKGNYSAPIHAKDGWHILKLLDTKPQATLALTDVHDALKQRLRAQKAEANKRAYLAKLLERSPPTINELALSQVLDQAHADAQLPAISTTPR